MTRDFLWLACNRPWAFEIVGRQAWRSVAANGPDWHLERCYGDMHFDYEYARSTDVWAMMGDACAYTFMQSHVPFFDDLVVRQIDVRPLFQRLRRDMHWLLDAVEVYSPDKRPGSFYHETDLDQIERDSPHLRIHKVEGAADLIAYQQPERVAKAIGAAAHRSRKP